MGRTRKRLLDSNDGARPSKRAHDAASDASDDECIPPADDINQSDDDEDDELSSAEGASTLWDVDATQSDVEHDATLDPDATQLEVNDPDATVMEVNDPDATVLEVEALPAATIDHLEAALPVDLNATQDDFLLDDNVPPQKALADRQTDVERAWGIARCLASHVSAPELHHIHYGVPPSGPPTRAPLKENDELASTFVWPVNPKNVLSTEFEQDASTIQLDLDLDSDSDTETAVEPTLTALPALPRPLCEIVTDRCRQHGLQPTPTTTSHLGYLARQSNVFLDKMLESLLTRNAMALQGNEQHFSSSSWTMYKGMPCANWRFVAEGLLQATDGTGRAHSVLPRQLTDATKKRIEARIRALYDQPWQTLGLNAPVWSVNAPSSE
ncbi:hypothetical protein SPRG_09724 [Saprolegnia parasitica CBS 223.65]|uniref:Uncharacterized protein n=1 Tax=Saprolegnia parasitica (strain CBS 223.65) TaxID=695850 RepID=A0A067C2H7_SAPPC|nr:hypothetical protein SPRG_09724 [Saprolegnia parasitica CBS 223.65]KDO24994.1 hypothetical protein SPRG_09724 [Saprolegnia parasitica CBS 223.65]|eukprot:XP_012204263.1 hypothetical protein SPRG_09724 [Saprolegnia parasitica CBS 223.65]